MSAPVETLAALLARIESTAIAPAFQPRPYTVDWGNTRRGQGKRAGGMVLGSMSDAPRGRRTYLEQVPNESPEARHEVNMLDDWERQVYLRARSAGLPHVAAECVAWASADPTISAEQLAQALADQGVALAS